VALYTKKLIMTTFQEMLAEMLFDRITVSALVKRAGGSFFAQKRKTAQICALSRLF